MSKGEFEEMAVILPKSYGIIDIQTSNTQYFIFMQKQKYNFRGKVFSLSQIQKLIYETLSITHCQWKFYYDR